MRSLGRKERGRVSDEKRKTRARDYLDADGNPLPWSYGKVWFWFAIFIAPWVLGLMFVILFPYKTQTKFDIEWWMALMVLCPLALYAWIWAYGRAYPEQITTMLQAEREREVKAERKRADESNSDPY